MSRTHVGKPLGEAIHNPEISFTLSGSAKEALDLKCDVFVEYTKPDVARQNILLALEAGAHVVVGTSGLTDEDYARIDREAKSRQLEVLAVGNFAITAVLLQKFARLVPSAV